jgi:hypothetical protein
MVVEATPTWPRVGDSFQEFYLVFGAPLAEAQAGKGTARLFSYHGVMVAVYFHDGNATAVRVPYPATRSQLFEPSLEPHRFAALDTERPRLLAADRCWLVATESCSRAVLEQLAAL